MSSTAQRLEEIVAVGYGSQTRRELSTAVSSVGSADIVNQPVASIDAALQGKAAGVQVIQNAGNPGNAISVRVRGDASMSAEQSAAVRARRRADGGRRHLAAGPWRSGRGGYQRAQSRRCREHRRPEGRGGRLDLRIARVEWRGAHHDEARPGGSYQRDLQQLRRDASPRPSGSTCSIDRISDVHEPGGRERRLRRRLLRHRRRDRQHQHRLAGCGASVGPGELRRAGGRRRRLPLAVPCSPGRGTTRTAS